MAFSAKEEDIREESQALSTDSSARPCTPAAVGTVQLPMH